ncbi:SMP-30/gluconolactonase/LRE family protein [Sphingobacterium sp. LRF_L2]|uniref:SMP-30/gluconolactonase/LRE family protein n=1 Tax=Sphingobacterium sp. LRF_L2 TaxID=3369421 RepID=UPI003F5F31B8
MDTFDIYELADKLDFPEGPISLTDGSIWFVEKESGCITQYKSGSLHRYQVNGAPNGLAKFQHSIWYCDALQNSICKFDLETKETETMVDQIDGEPLFMPNDLAFDNKKNLIFTCPGPSLGTKKGYVCCLSESNDLTRIATGLDYPNGIAFSKDAKHLYIAETGSRKIWRGKWDDKKRHWLNPHPIIETGGSVGPDGMAFDEHGNLYIAIYGESSINVYNKKHELTKKIIVPGKNPTNCAFAISGTGLIITEAQFGKLLQVSIQAYGILPA